MDISPALDALLDLTLTVILAALIVGLLDAWVDREESEE